MTVVQFGISGDPMTAAKYFQTIPDDDRALLNLAGTLVFVSVADNDRATQLMINMVDNPILDQQGSVNRFTTLRCTASCRLWLAMTRWSHLRVSW
jgi:hypothetical protein